MLLYNIIAKGHVVHEILSQCSVRCVCGAALRALPSALPGAALAGIAIAAVRPLDTGRVGACGVRRHCGTVDHPGVMVRASATAVAAAAVGDGGIGFELSGGRRGRFARRMGRDRRHCGRQPVAGRRASMELAAPSPPCASRSRGLDRSGSWAGSVPSTQLA